MVTTAEFAALQERVRDLHKIVGFLIESQKAALSAQQDLTDAVKGYAMAVREMAAVVGATP